MEEQGNIRDSIIEAKSYSTLLRLRDTVASMRGRVPFSVYFELRGRVNEKIALFERPRCESVSITVIAPDGSRHTISQDQCREALSTGTLPDYVRSLYGEGADIQIEQKILAGGVELTQDRLEGIIERIDRIQKEFEEVYAFTSQIPRISSEIREINMRLDSLSKRLDALLGH
ncbi:hypothetical protein GCM10007108_14580 [Thermogymnomonas acidicola]|uniref:Uncharacterized protein n=1 Tax=Thermogymnomonas acidicola TaxID=399579 RepID=A0AA37BSH4_9ARCH|nr:hypothetical protein [Thermogymnomonas acidicola]GGM77525.1 hypothetical protein GCM10007108_14580 [Thermogymnomonas acidicola]